LLASLLPEPALLVSDTTSHKILKQTKNVFQPTDHDIFIRFSFPCVCRIFARVGKSFTLSALLSFAVTIQTICCPYQLNLSLLHNSSLICLAFIISSSKHRSFVEGELWGDENKVSSYTKSANIPRACKKSGLRLSHY